MDENRIYATGFSNGGIFTYVLWGARGTAFAALAPVAGEKFPGVHLAVLIPLLQIAGERDENVPFQQQLESIAIARAGRMVIANPVVPANIAPPTIPVDNSSPASADIYPVGHVYPRDASALIVDFFKQHTRSKTNRTLGP